MKILRGCYWFWVFYLFERAFLLYHKIKLKCNTSQALEDERGVLLSETRVLIIEVFLEAIYLI